MNDSIDTSNSRRENGSSEGRPVKGIPCASAPYIVTIDGQPYAGFTNRDDAEMAMRLWLGEISGSGSPATPGNATHAWPRARGRSLKVVSR
jgi:hypothetical protein